MSRVEAPSSPIEIILVQSIEAIGGEEEDREINEFIL